VYFPELQDHIIRQVHVWLELLAEEIENPFGEDSNDLPVDDICNTIKENVEEILIESR